MEKSSDRSGGGDVRAAGADKRFVRVSRAEILLEVPEQGPRYHFFAGDVCHYEAKPTKTHRETREHVREERHFVLTLPQRQVAAASGGHRN